MHVTVYADFNSRLCCCFQFSDSITIFCRSQKCSSWCLCERVAGGRWSVRGWQVEGGCGGGWQVEGGCGGGWEVAVVECERVGGGCGGV